MGRAEIAYTVPAAGFHDLFASFVLLAKKFPTPARKTPMYRIACATWILLLTFISIQLSTLDWILSPSVANIIPDPKSPNGVKVIPEAPPTVWFGIMVGLNFLFNFIASIGIWAMALNRLSVFYGRSSFTFIAMLFMSTLLGLIKGAADGIGTYIGFVEIGMSPVFILPEACANWQLSLMLHAIGHTFEAAFLFLSSYFFLVSIAKGVGLSRGELWYALFVEYEGFRFIAIMILNLIISGFGIYNAIMPQTFVTHTALYLPSWTYAVEFYAFLQTSYYTARHMIKNSSTPKSKEKSSELSKINVRMPIA
ncbi:hypothetical protein EDD86DRAFT_244721 [Gorgonomyces haynaldii]|nr:hypothetical protein EDD86DRAFT_244721 [Gorgonomyces haynaldii]